VAYFSQKLLDWRQTLLTETQEALMQFKDGSQHAVGDEVDRASPEASQTLELRTRERCRSFLDEHCGSG